MDTTDILEHSGVKGMKWGVRNDKVVGTDRGTNVTKGDLKWKQKKDTFRNLIEVNNRMADGVNNDLIGLNKKYGNKDLGFDQKTGSYSTAAGKKYVKEYETMAAGHAAKAVKEVFGDSPSGNWTAAASYSVDNGLSIDFVPSDVKHSGMVETKDGFQITLDVTTDSDGFFTPMETKDVQHSDLVKDFLAHYGVKGQKWGVRRRRQSQASKDHATNRKLAAMSDAELQQTVNRIRMEKQYKELEKSKIKKGHDAAKTILAVGATVNAAIAFSKSPAGKVIASTLKKEQTLMPLRTLG